MIELNFYSLIFSSLTKNSLYNFFYKRNVKLNEEENEALFNHIRKYRNEINFSNYKKYLFDPLLKIRYEKKKAIEKALDEFI